MLRLKSKLDNNETLLSAWCGIPGGRYLEAICAHPFDTVLMDMQHGFYDESTVQDGIVTALHNGKAPLVRIPVGRWDTASRVMDFGALGVVAPMVNTVEDAQQFAAFMKYVPVGERSYSPRHAARLQNVDVTTYLNGIDEASLALAMIETRQAYDNLDDILGVEGIDGVLIGPADLSISFRNNRIADPYGPDTIDVVQDIINRTAKAGKISAAFAMNSPDANRLHKFGANIISLGLDQSYIDFGIKPQIEALDFKSY